MITKHTFILTLLFPFGIFPAVNAQIKIIDFQTPEVVGTSTSQVSDWNAPFTESTIIDQTMSTGFEGQGTLFGGSNYTADSGGTRPQLRSATTGFLPGRFYATVPQNHAMSVLLMWDQSNFLNGGDSTPLSLGAGSSITLTGNNLDVSQHMWVEDTWGYRMVVRDNGNYYISYESTGSTSTGYVIDDFSTNTWAVFDPTANDGNLNTLSGTIVGYDPSLYSIRSFNDVTAVGFYLHAGKTNGTEALAITGFEVVAIPEPGSLALLVVAIFLLTFNMRKWGP